MCGEEGEVLHVTLPLDSAIAERMIVDLFGWTREGAAGDAQGLVYQAWDCESRKNRVELARRALEINPDCADAYVVLAQDAASSMEEAVGFFHSAVEAGIRILGAASPEERVCDFRDFLETAPYKRALLGLAECLWEGGRLEEAVECCRKMLEFDPLDHQGIRYLMATCLADLEWDDPLQELLDRYPEDRSAPWIFCDALLAFRKEGDTERSRSILAEAKTANPHVPGFMLGRTPMPAQSPLIVGYGDETEAIVFTADFISGWKRTPGALEWLEKNDVGVTDGPD
jgi:tetratricopeptide (TPR) repeat protein